MTDEYVAYLTVEAVSGFRLDLDQDGKFDLIMAMAGGELRGVQAIAACLPLVRA